MTITTIIYAMGYLKNMIIMLVNNNNNNLRHGLP